MLGSNHVCENVETLVVWKYREFLVEDFLLDPGRHVQVMVKSFELLFYLFRLEVGNNFRQRFLNSGFEVFKIDRLRHKIICATVHRRSDVFHISVG